MTSPKHKLQLWPPSHLWSKLPALSRLEKLVVVLTILVMAALAIAGAGLLYGKAGYDEAARNAGQKNAAVSALGTANATISKLGGSPIATPTSAAYVPSATATVTVSGARGDTGASGSGPSTVQIESAVALFCSTNGNCGVPPTTAQVAQAVANYCSNAACTGAAGTSGTNGKDGQNATADQIATAVANYCAQNSCQGPVGPTGPAGSPGTNGTNGQGVGGFTFTVPGALGTSTTYTCTPDATGTAVHYSCAAS